MTSIRWDSVQLLETLNIDWHTKYIALLVNISSDVCPEGAVSIIMAQRQGFDQADDLFALLKGQDDKRLSSQQTKLCLIENNDIYYRFSLFREGMINCAIQLIHPATSAHVAKYRHQERVLLRETPTLYTNITLPFIERQAAHRIKWVENILGGKSEQDRVLFRKDGEQDGFVILPDHKWDQRSMSSLYLLALVKRRDIKSLRDLNGSHLLMLKELRDIIRRETPRIFPSVSADQLRLYVHYLPTYFYFHLHIVHVDFEMPGCAVGAAHLLDDIIDNIECFGSDYYQRRTLPIIIGKQHELYALLR